MKAKVLIRFRDKLTKALHEPGEIIECSKERYEEIISKRPLVEAVEEDNNDGVKVNIKKMTVAQLKEFADEKEIDLGDAKTKKEILEKIDGDAE